MGLVPVYIANIKSKEDMQLTTRNWVPDWLFDVAQMLHTGMCMAACSYMPFSIKITGRLDGGSLFNSRGELR